MTLTIPIEFFLIEVIAELQNVTSPKSHLSKLGFFVFIEEKPEETMKERR
jgi:hypothetical protein